MRGRRSRYAERVPLIRPFGPPTLARHGVNVTVTSQEKIAGVSPQAAIENRLSDNSIDLLVMGAYGHSRWWELLFGGVTRTLLDSMTALTLLSR